MVVAAVVEHARTRLWQPPINDDDVDDADVDTDFFVSSASAREPELNSEPPRWFGTISIKTRLDDISICLNRLEILSLLLVYVLLLSFRFKQQQQQLTAAKTNV